MLISIAVMALFASLCPDGVPGVSSPDFGDSDQPPAAISYADYGMWTRTLNERLRALGFNADDGAAFGRHTRHAVYAFEKYHRLDPDGVIGAAEWQLLDLQPWVVPASPGDRVEIDLGRQILLVVEANRVDHVVPISSGNGGTYINEAGASVTARTPEGRFRFRSRIAAMHYSYLGAMYYPYYFNGGYAVHGSPSVPNHPASHGCVRVTYWDMGLLWEHFELGQLVHVYGRRVAPPESVPAAVPAPQYR